MFNRICIVVSLLAIAVQLIVLRGFDVRQQLFLVLPVLAGLSVASGTSTSPGPVVARVLLMLLGAGLLIARFPVLFPRLGGFDPLLDRQSDRVLAWYTFIYLMFATLVLPWVWFTDSLCRHRLGAPAQFSRLTCYLGLVTSLLLAPGMIAISIQFLHLWPLI